MTTSHRQPPGFVPLEKVMYILGSGYMENVTCRNISMPTLMHIMSPVMISA
jgi:hypothetical protein